MASNLLVPKRERILDAAEELFARHGFDGVTLRQIASAASVDVALANYHFGKKRDLFEATFLRRAEVLNTLRLEALEEAEAELGEDLHVENIVRAFLDPIQQLQVTGDAGWLNYLALVAYVNSSSVWGEQMMHESFDPLVSQYITAFKKALPGVPDERIYWAYHYLSGALTLTLAQTSRIDRLSDGICRSSDVETAYNLMVPFVAAGFERICLEI